MSLAHERAGSGPSLVLLHGLGHRRQGWGAVHDMLTPHRDVISVDLPGHGQSPPLRTNGQDPVVACCQSWDCPARTWRGTRSAARSP